MNATLGGVSSGGLVSYTLDGKMQTIFQRPNYGTSSTFKGVLLGPALGPVVGPTGQSVGTGSYQRLLNSNKKKLD